MEPLDALDDEKWVARVKRVLKGLKAPKDSGEYKSAVMAMERTLGPSFAAATVCGMVLVLLITFVATQAIPTDTEIEVQVVEAETIEIDLEDIELPPPEPLDPVEMVDNSIAPPDAAPTANLEAEVLGMGPTADSQQMIPNAPLITRSPIVLRNLYGNRSAAGRAAAVRRYGGSQRTETAVLKALRWLKRTQNEDGSWRTVDTKSDIAMTGLALLSFLAHGETPESEEFGNAVEKSIKYLVSRQNSAGQMGSGGYIHGIAAYALSEAYAMTRIMALQEAMERSIEVVIRGQQPGGGFDYNYAKGDRVDLSVAGWQVQAMKAAQLGGATNEGLEEALERSADYLRNGGAGGAWSPQNNMFRYGGSGGGRWTMNGVGVLCMQLLGLTRHANTRNGLASMSDITCSWNPEGNNGLYGWYYVTQALFHQGGATWKRWNNQFSDMLVANQHEDGYWDGADHGGGKVYSTTLAVLMLQVYYRYLPTFQTPEEIAVDIDAVSSSDDVVIEIL